MTRDSSANTADGAHGGRDNAVLTGNVPGAGWYVRCLACDFAWFNLGNEEAAQTIAGRHACEAAS